MEPNQAEVNFHDADLLRRYAQEGSEDAFARLTERYSRLVYSTCKRQLVRHEWAEDAAVTVFVLLAEKARGLVIRDSLSGWLYKTSLLVILPSASTGLSNRLSNA